MGDIRREREGMKKYSTSEAIAMLEKNPKLVFEAEVRVCGDIGTGKRVRMWVNSCHEIQIDGVSVGVRYGLNTNDEWELVQQPVDFITAVKAYSEGKTIRCERNGRIEGWLIPDMAKSKIVGEKCWVKLFLNPTKMDRNLSTTNILQDSWYVEESNE